MSRLCVAPIVEGHGEEGAVRVLLQRIWNEVLGEEYIHVIRPIRGSRHKLVRKEELGRMITLAAAKLESACAKGDPRLILVLLDADDDLPCILGPELSSLAAECRPDVDIACVLPNVEYESWFVAAADSLREFLDLPADVDLPAPEETRLGKAWIQKRFRGPKYSETLDQPRMTAMMDLELCRGRSASFDKLCRELEARRRVSPDA